jgi:hypothetical protein
MTTETTANQRIPDAPECLTDHEIDELRAISSTDGQVRLDGDQLRALVATLDFLQSRRQSLADALDAVRQLCNEGHDAGCQCNECKAMRIASKALAGIPVKHAPEPFSPTVAILALTKAVNALIRSNPGEAWQHMRPLGEFGQEVR